jgi:hypothetical protein
MNVTNVLPHPQYLEDGWKPDVKFKGGYDIAIAVVEFSKGTTHLSKEEIEEFTSSLNLPEMNPLDLVN